MKKQLKIRTLYYRDNYSLGLSIEGKEYEYVGISPYVKEQIQKYIRFKNYSSLFSTLKKYTKQGE